MFFTLVLTDKTPEISLTVDTAEEENVIFLPLESIKYSFTRETESNVRQSQI